MGIPVWNRSRSATVPAIVIMPPVRRAASWWYFFILSLLKIGYVKTSVVHAIESRLSAVWETGPEKLNTGRMWFGSYWLVATTNKIVHSFPGQQIDFDDFASGIYDQKDKAPLG